MAVVIMSHSVADFGQWKKAYDEDVQRRVDAGFKELACGHKADDPNMVYLVWETDTPEVLDQMLADPDLAAKMQAAGVTSKPEVVVLK